MKLRPLHRAPSFATLALLLATACGPNVHFVRRQADGGELRLSGTYMDRAAEAQVVMAAYCGGRFAVLVERDGHVERVQAPEPEQSHVSFVCLAEDAPASRVGNPE